MSFGNGPGETMRASVGVTEWELCLSTTLKAWAVTSGAGPSFDHWILPEAVMVTRAKRGRFFRIRFIASSWSIARGLFVLDLLLCQGWRPKVEFSLRARLWFCSAVLKAHRPGTRFLMGFE